MQMTYLKFCYNKEHRRFAVAGGEQYLRDIYVHIKVNIHSMFVHKVIGMIHWEG